MVSTMPLLVKVVRAVNLIAADSNGFSDPFCKIKLRNSKPKQQFTTETVKKTINPEWNEEFKFIVFVGPNIHNFLELSVYDKDFAGKDFLGGCLIQLDEFMDGNVYDDVEYPLSGEDMDQGSIFLSFAPTGPGGTPKKKAQPVPQKPNKTEKPVKVTKQLDTEKDNAMTLEGQTTKEVASQLAKEVKTEELGGKVPLGDTETKKQEAPPPPAKKSGLFARSGSGLFGTKKKEESEADKNIKVENNNTDQGKGVGPQSGTTTSTTTTTTATTALAKKKDFFGKMGDSLGDVFGKKKDKKKEAESNKEINLVSGDMRITVMNCKALRAADKNGSSDPFVSIKYAWQIEETTLIEKTLNPVWDESFLFKFHNNEVATIVIDVMDRDVVGMNDFLGRVELDLKQLAGEDQLMELPLQPRSEKERAAGKAQGTIELFVELSKVSPEMAAAVKVNRSRRLQTPPSGSFDLLLLFFFSLLVYLYGTL